MRVVDLTSYELEVIEVNLKQSEYELKVVQLVKSLLEIDRFRNQQQDQLNDLSTTLEMKEAA